MPSNFNFGYNPGSMSRMASFIGLLPAHYQRDISWSSAQTTIISPNSLTVNINNSGYILSAQQTILLGTAASWDSIATNYTIAANRAGKDFYIYACQPSAGTTPVIVLSANSTVPTGNTATNSRKIGGFHCLCMDVGTISGHTLTMYAAGDILPASVWDLNFRPVSQPEGMVYSSQLNLWIDIYLQSNTGVSTKSANGAVITDTRSWNDHVDDLAAVSKKMLDDTEFQIAAEGSNQQTNIVGSTDPNTTGGHVDTASRRMISNIGCEDCAGAMYQWLRDQSYQFQGAVNHTHTENTAVAYTQNATTGNPSVDIAPTFAWKTIGRNKGLFNGQGTYGDVKLLAGGNWSVGTGCGSRSREASSCRWGASSSVGSRGRSENISK